MFKSSRKKLIAIGCSFTEHYLSSTVSPDVDYDFTRWPEHLANMLDMECINLGKAGAGNDRILAKTLDTTLGLEKKDIGLIVVMWSDWRRVGFQCSRDWDHWTHITPHELETWKVTILKKQNSFHATRNTLRTFIHAEKILSDLPYMFVQGTANLTWNEDNWTKNQYSRRIAANEILKSPYLDYIENNIANKFIGWPIMNELGGYSIDDYLNKQDPESIKLRISLDDCHPNAAGHKAIAEFLYDKYKEIYNED